MHQGASPIQLADIFDWDVFSPSALKKNCENLVFIGWQEH